MECITYCETFEKREELFRSSIQAPFPRKYLGASIFWKDLAKSFSNISNQSNQLITYISSDPKDCIAYSFVDDLLGATKLLLPNNKRDELLSDVIDKYLISQIQGQKIHTLSGGEIVRLALAKSDLLSTIVDEVIISSPLTWLSKSNKSLYDLFVNRYSAQNKRISVFSMQGENDLDTVIFDIDKHVESTIIINNLKILLSSEEKFNKVNELWGIVKDTELTITSPCLLTGDNGSGKSLIAKALSNAINYTGDAKLRTRGYLGKSRLLFQDVIMQTMLRSFDVLANSTKNINSSKLNSTYKKLIDSFSMYFLSKKKEVPYIGELNSESKTLLEYKFLLIAIRLCSQPAAIILDEPDWGLSKDSAVAFVNTVIESAHDEYIPIILISHKEWWNNIAKTHLEVSKKMIYENDVKYEFSIQNKSYIEGDIT